ncbi:SDR family NAD(P)-dependent oxidoreductase [Shewanella woodyi]|uniref:Short-chain dehydrogenase/reductase SDR n=1 Tax=Shewanella woodyi (strain ATCC 51908 / MS32) TaxID=392500 RepID=B1KD93_SHEWM|nr:SDR family oxidoreductase [Shewanella woodyi]ACA87928.1 short-chain dehydrogenase/reductase SDR [Shewanella woodyi ATCC 51908]
MTISQLDYRLGGRGVFITGGASGIGAALVRAFVEQGANVTFVDTNRDAGEALLQGLDINRGQQVAFHLLDVTDTKQLQQMITEQDQKLGQLDILINNVGNDSRHDADGVDEHEWKQCMAINLDSAFFASQAAYLVMKQRKQGVIINFSSNMAYIGERNMAGYITAKAGIAGMTKALAKDYGESRVRVNAIVPGWVATQRQLEQWLSPEQEQQLMEKVAIQKRITPEDIAKLALFLTSEDSELITGQCMVIDGGRV